MTRQHLVTSIADAISEKEGFFADAEHPDFPTIAQQLCNPGNVRAWTRHHPKKYGYIDFYGWAAGNAEEADWPRRPTRSTSGKKRREILDDIKDRMDARNPVLREKALAEGRRVLEAVVGQYIDGKYTNGQSPSLLRMFSVYAPSSDGNNPFRYAEFVGEKLGLRRSMVLEKPLKELINE